MTDRCSAILFKTP